MAMTVSPGASVVESPQVATLGTGEAAFRAAMDLTAQVGKKVVVCQKDVPGFLGNRILYALLREAMYCYEQGIGTAEDIDTMVREAFENAMAIVMAVGGSTNAVMHLIAMAKSVGVRLTIEFLAYWASLLKLRVAVLEMNTASSFPME